MKKKKNKKTWRNTLIALLFSAAIFAAPALFFLQPKKDFSEREKRYLAEAPTLSLQSLLSGEFTEKLGRYVADHFPEREFFVGLNAYLDLYTGRQGVKDYFLSEDGRLFARPVDDDLRTLDANLASINRFARDLAGTEADIPVTLMLVPSSGAVLLDEPPYPDGEIIAYAYERAETGHVDLLPAFRGSGDPDSLYYRTDHHWTSEGAFRAACAYRRALGLSVPTEESYTRQSYTPFYGSAYAGSGLWLTAPDSLELWYSGNVMQVSNETGQTNSSVFYLDRLEEQDKYRVFLDGNHALVRIENLSRTDEEARSLLVVRDSFSNSLGCFLAGLYDKVILVDLRYYKLPLTDLLLDEDIDEVLIEYSVDNFLHDANLTFLSVDPEPIRLKVEEERRPPNYFAPPPVLDQSFFDGAYFLGDSVNGVLGMYCAQNGLLRGATIGTNAMLSYTQTVKLKLGHLIYKGNYTTLPQILEDLRPRIIIGQLGCNDLANNSVGFSEDIVLEFLEMVRAYDPDIPIFMQSVMPIRLDMDIFNQQEVDEYNAWLKANAETYNYCYIELDKYFKAEDGQLNRSYMYNPTHINLGGAPLWYEQLMNTENYFNFPEQYYVEFDGETNLPVENGASPAEAAPPPEESAPPEETVLDEIYAQIRGRVSCPDMLLLNERTVNSYLGLQPEDFADGRFYICSNNLKADEIWLVELADEASAQAMLEKAQERCRVKAGSYDKYLPEESEIARRGIAVAKGNLVALFISPDAAQMRDIFLAG